jgi:hypothetical protein
MKTGRQEADIQPASQSASQPASHPVSQQASQPATGLEGLLRYHVITIHPLTLCLWWKRTLVICARGSTRKKVWRGGNVRVQNRGFDRNCPGKEGIRKRGTKVSVTPILNLYTAPEPNNLSSGSSCTPHRHPFCPQHSVKE